MSVNPPPLGILHHASKQWLNYLISHGLTDEVNFWTKVKANFSVREDQFFFFKERNMIFGAGQVTRVEKLTIREAWEKYGIRNGSSSLNDFQNSIETSGIPFEEVSGETELLCIILKDIQEFPEIPLKDVGLGRVWNFKYVDKDVLRSIEQRFVDNYTQSSISQAGSMSPKLSLRIAKSRLFQRAFRARILDVFFHKCVLCNCDVDQLLQASHIVEVWEDLSIAADPDNGLCLCANHHRMFDRHLISIIPEREKGIVRLQSFEPKSSSFLKEEFEALNGSVIELRSAETAKYLSRRNEKFTADL